MNKIKFLIALMVIVVSFMFINNFIGSNTDDTSNLTKKKILDANENRMKSVKQYKDVFKEENQISKFETLQNMKKLDKLDQESEKIIAKNDLIIKNNNLVLPHKELSLEEKEKRKQQDEELEKLKQKVEELSREN